MWRRKGTVWYYMSSTNERGYEWYPFNKTGPKEWDLGDVIKDLALWDKSLSETRSYPFNKTGPKEWDLGDVIKDLALWDKSLSETRSVSSEGLFHIEDLLRFS
ncbi:hypothetical protein CBL_06865 [Carabus blaptoides fortunei]